MIPVLITRAEKLYFAAVGALALWVGLWGYFNPKRVDAAIPWLVPPLHARFLGAVYLSAFVLLALGMLAKRYGEVRNMVPLITIWTGMLCVVSLFYLDQFDFHRKPVYFWWGAYILYPIIGLRLIWRHRGDGEELGGTALPTWARRYYLAQGLILSCLAVALLADPDWVATIWPWKITRLLAQIYSAPFFAYGFCSLLSSREKTFLGVRIVTLGSLVLTSGVLLASILHRTLFSAQSPSTWVWFLFFSLTTLVLAVLGALSLRRGAAA